MNVRPIPDGYHSVTPYLTVSRAREIISFLEKAFDAKLTHEPIHRPDGSLMHAEVQIGDSRVMLADESEMAKASPTTLYLYVPDVDGAFQKAAAAGGKTIMQPADMFYGDRCAGVKDSAGNSWMLATHIEDVPLPELQRRAEDFFAKRVV